MRNVRGPFGLSFADHEGGTYASVFLAPVRTEAAEQDFSWVTILAYAATHRDWPSARGQLGSYAVGL